MKKILLSAAVIVPVLALVIGGTIAFYNDTETSSGNIFVAGSIDLKVDHTYAEYNGVECVGDCNPTGSELITNGGFETPNLSSGQWQVYPDGTQTSWEVTGGAGLEIQDHAAGDPHSGSQLAELDSHNQSSIKQVVNTIPGQKYRLTFWHSPRPNNNAGDNAIDFTVKVTSTNGVMINDTVELNSAGGSNTSWTEYVYNFIALDTQTTVEFADTGSENDSYGGYLDDVSIRALDCSPQNPSFPNAGICSVWGEKDLGSGDTFWNFPDIKPGDRGTNVLSLHVYDNDAFACLLPNNVKNDENTPVEPEITAGDDNSDGHPNGELGQQLEFFMWEDANGNNAFESGETVLLDAGTPFNQIQTELVQLSLVGNSPISLVGMSWCAGTQTGPTTGDDSIPLSCDGNGMTDIVQTDILTADFVAYAVQQRNNEGFSCSQVQLTD